MTTWKTEIRILRAKGKNLQTETLTTLSTKLDIHFSLGIIKKTQKHNQLQSTECKTAEINCQWILDSIIRAWYEKLHTEHRWEIRPLALKSASGKFVIRWENSVTEGWEVNQHNGDRSRPVTHQCRNWHACHSMQKNVTTNQRFCALVTQH